MDLAKHERAVAAEVYRPRIEASKRDQALIASVFRAHPVQCIDQHLALGGCCPYWQSQRREIENWLHEIARQRQLLEEGNK
jgi:hypothetical protein